jgi:hypothetical protein
MRRCVSPVSRTRAWSQQARAHSVMRAHPGGGQLLQQADGFEGFVSIREEPTPLRSCDSRARHARIYRSPFGSAYELPRLPEQTVTHPTGGALYRIGACDHQRVGASTWLSASADAGDRFGLGDGLRTRWDRSSRWSLRGWRTYGQPSHTTQGGPSASRSSSGKAGESTRDFRPTFTTSPRTRDLQGVKPLDGWTP